MILGEIRSTHSHIKIDWSDTTEEARLGADWLRQRAQDTQGVAGIHGNIQIFGFWVSSQAPAWDWGFWIESGLIGVRVSDV